MEINSEILAEIEKLKKDCIVLSHNYQIPEIQDVADFVGDSLGLCQKAAKVDKPYIFFCGVDFMAESAAMLNPKKIVAVPEPQAKCPMAAKLPASLIIEAKKKNPEAAVVLYINTLLEARAEADVICTSANAIEIVKAMPQKEIIFGPDWALAWHVQRHLPEKKIIVVPTKGACITHMRIEAEHIRKAKEEYPNAEVLVHPECKPEVQLLADKICSTEQMIRRARESDRKEFIIGTEVGILHRLKKEIPGKVFVPAYAGAVCGNMKKNTWEKFLEGLREKQHIVKIDPEVARKARKSLDKMLEITG